MALLILPTARAVDLGEPLLGTVKLAWDLSWEPDIAGYRVHWGAESGTYTETADVGYQVKAQLDDLPVGNSYFCAVTAYNIYGLESPYSNEISFTVAPPPEARDSDGDGLSDLFEASHSASGDLDPGADLNGDGLTTLGEYAHGLDPLAPHNQPFSQVETNLIDGERYLSIRYLVDPLAERFVTIHVERSIEMSDPGGWERNCTVIVSCEASSEVPGLVEIVARSLTPICSQPREFLRFAYEPKAP